jgi:hypothetical protein
MASEAYSAIVAHMTANGLNDANMVEEFFRTETDAQLVDEMIKGHGLDRVLVDDRRSWMAEHGVSRADLIDLMALYRDAFAAERAA